MRRRVSQSLVAAAILSLALAAPTLGAKPHLEVISLDDPDVEAALSAEFTEACGVPIAVDVDGTVTVHVFTDRDGNFKREVDKYWIRDRFTNLATGASVLLKDVGPDIVWFNRQGELMLAITGRSLTGSNVIGRTLINLDTGVLVRESGRAVGTVEEQVCGALT